MKDKRLRCAVIGLGKMGLVHTGILNVLPETEVVAVCEKGGLIRKFARKILRKIEVVDDAEKLCEFNLDAVYVTTPIPTHFPVAKTVLTKRIAPNLFVEKTLAQTYEESMQLTKLAERLSNVNMVGYLRRFYVTFKKAKDLLNKGTLGAVTSFEAYAYSSDFCEVEKGSKASISRGGVLKDLGCHAVDLALWFFDKLKVDQVEQFQNGDHISDSLKFKVNNNELEGDFSISWRMFDYRLPEVGFLIRGSLGELIVNDNQVKLKITSEKPVIWHRHDLDDSVPFLLGLPEYYREDYHFVESIINSKRAEPNFSQASEVDKIISEVDRSR
jgi:predicted dehydrogenase